MTHPAPSPPLPDSTLPTALAAMPSKRTPGAPEHGDRTSEDALADGMAQQVERWALQLGALPAAAQAAAVAARAVCAALAEGHVCIGLDELPAGPVAAAADAAAWRSLLSASRVVAEVGADGALLPDAPRSAPLCLDDQGRLALHRLHRAETRLARRIAQRLRDDARAPWTQTAHPVPAMLPGETAGADWQRIAVALGTRQRLLVVSGGPGTGKTTVVAWLLAQALAAQPGLRVALSAPTGKAAARLAQSVQSRAAELPEAVRAALPASAQTVHRLIGAQPDGPDRFHAGRPLPLDLLVVDEASMLDLDLATRLFDALPDSARVVLLGDQDQLAAVEAGAVFAELSAHPGLSEGLRAALAGAVGSTPDALTTPPPRGPGLGPDHTVWLQRNFRFGDGSSIALLAAEVREGRSGEALARLAQAGPEGEALAWLDDGGSALGDACWSRITEGYAGYVKTLVDGAGDPAAVFAAWEGFRVLCAVREGPRGVAAVNDALMRWLRRQLAATAWASGRASPWCAGRPVMVLRNDASLRLSNGDVGLAMPDGDGWAVLFPDGAGGFRSVPAGRLPAHETAFATTVHKSQGSEWERVLVLLPARSGHTPPRELLYTGITRARSQVTVAASAGALQRCIDTPTRRQGALASRIAALRDAPGA